MKYPLLMVHGMGFRDHEHLCYWGRIPKVLEKKGIKTYFGGQDSNGSVKTNAEQLAVSVDKILSETGAEKLNVIAHSKGGLDMRYLISSMGYGDKIASLTTLSTPHNGSETVDILNKFPDGLVKGCCKLTDVWFRLLGDSSPDTYSAVNLFKTAEAERFNEANPMCEGVYYQSYAFVMEKGTSDVFMIFPHAVVKGIEGECDGLLAPKAVMYADFKGICKGTGRRGISHFDEVDMRRSSFPVTVNGVKYKDITHFYVGIVKGLEKMGF